MKSASDETIVYSIGHSTMSIEKFVGVLRAHSVRVLADIRTIPRSRHNPQFEGETLRESLSRESIVYVHFADLGGLRKPRKDSPNEGWRNPSFRGYADYMQTDKFGAALDSLIQLAKKSDVAIMCAEGNPFRCHRSLVADALLQRGVRVFDISSEGPGRLHRRTPFAKVVDGRVVYPR